MPTVVCYGDSNTHGADPVDGQRYPRDVRWPGVMRAALGEGWEVIEEGLNGRTTIWDVPWSEGRNGRDFLQPCLWSHAPVDLVVIMLGTNDLKSVLDLSAPEIASGAGHLVELARGSLAGPAGGPPSVLLVSPVPLGEATERSDLWGFGHSRAVSRELAALYRLVAASRGADFFDAGSVCSASPLDGVHLDEEGHRSLGLALAAEVGRTLGASGGGARD